MARTSLITRTAAGMQPSAAPLTGVAKAGTIPSARDLDPGPGGYAMRLDGHCLGPDALDSDMVSHCPAAARRVRDDLA